MQFDKAAQYADHKKFDLSVYLTSRLAPDMYAFTKQVQVAADFAKGTAARLTGQTPPVSRTTRRPSTSCAPGSTKTIAFLKTLKPADFEGAETRNVEISWLKGKGMPGFEYTTQIGLPNFYFHLTAAYAILRHNGVDVGKGDYMGKIDEPRSL